ncbi:MAG: carboxypeptidase-like regulatory domain-containing protein [Candidatus Limnocylindrales bacterium]
MDSIPGSPPMSRRRSVSLVIALAGCVLALSAACTPAPAPPPIASTPQLISTGVRGTVLAGPTCPVERAGESACVRAVAGATIVALASGGQEVGRAVSDDAGSYFLRLPPGNYRIVPQAVQGLMGVAAPTSVDVTAGSPVQLDLEYDTGIR